MDILKVKNIGIWGDSILKGIVFDDEKGKYKALKDTAVALFNKVFKMNIKNNSRFGCTAPKGMINMKSTIEKGYTPDVALLEFGGNDCDYNWLEVSNDPSKKHNPNTPFKEFCDTIEKMVNLLIKNNIKPLLMNLPPIDGYRYFNWISKLEGVNADNILNWLCTPNAIYCQQERYSSAIERLALKKGLLFVDVRSKFLSIRNYVDYLCKDGIHLNGEGHKLMASIFTEYAYSV